MVEQAPKYLRMYIRSRNFDASKTLSIVAHSRSMAIQIDTILLLGNMFRYYQQAIVTLLYLCAACVPDYRYLRIEAATWGWHCEIYAGTIRCPRLPCAQ